MWLDWPGWWPSNTNFQPRGILKLLFVNCAVVQAYSFSLFSSSATHVRILTRILTRTT